MRTIFDLIVKTTTLSESFQKLATNEIATRQEFSERMANLDNQNLDQVRSYFIIYLVEYLTTDIRMIPYYFSNSLSR